MNAVEGALGEPPGAAAPMAPSRWQRWLRSSWGRILAFAVIATTLVAALLAASAALGWRGKDADPALRLFVQVLVQTLPFIVAYLVVVRWLEQRRPAELVSRHFVAHAALGLAGGVALISAVVAVLALAGAYAVTRVDAGAPWLKPLLTAGIGAAVSEEIIFRGMLFRIWEERAGTWMALARSAALFGAVHIMNPNADVWSSIAIALEAGVLLGAIYHVWRSLPLVMGVHAGWNIVQGTLFGIPVSGTTAEGWLVSERHGPDWLTGGAFGVEASAVTVLLSALVATALLVRAQRRGTIVRRRR